MILSRCSLPAPVLRQTGDGPWLKDVAIQKALDSEICDLMAE